MCSRAFTQYCSPFSPCVRQAGRVRDLIAPCVERLAKLFRGIATSATILFGQTAYRDLGLPLAPPVSTDPRRQPETSQAKVNP